MLAYLGPGSGGGRHRDQRPQGLVNRPTLADRGVDKVIQIRVRVAREQVGDFLQAGERGRWKGISFSRRGTGCSAVYIRKCLRSEIGEGKCQRNGGLERAGAVGSPSDCDQSPLAADSTEDAPMTDPPPTARKCEKLCFLAKAIASSQLEKWSNRG